ncbi:MAG: hypothetical protein HOP04_06940 [Methylophilaceae bacterium]|nr:hypothetical protein [Methylophilaceae bacterium]
MNKLIFCIVCLISLASCSGYREGVTVAEPVSYLAFGGNTTGAIVKIDEGISFALSDGRVKTTESNTGEKDKYLANTHYKVTPGKHRIQVVKNGEVVIDRELLIGDGITREIIIP